MLQFLRIRNLALLEEVSLEFDEGFTVVTGETGAGKSILLGALSLLAGARAEKSIIRQAAAACEVEGSLFFRDPRGVNDLLAGMSLPECEEGVLLIKRMLAREKAPRITINGALATLSNLQELGGLWIDFHGPSEPRRLLRPDCQLELLDLYAANDAERAAYGQAYERWRKLVSERERVAREDRLDEDQIQYLRNQLARFSQVELEDAAIEKLEADFRRSSQSRELTELAQSLASGLVGEGGVLAKVAALVREGGSLEQIDPANRPLVERLSSLSIEVEDLGREFEALTEGFLFEPEEAENLQNQMNLWLELRRKYGGDAGAVRAARDQIASRLELQGDLEGVLARLEKESLHAEKAVREAAAILRRSRERAAVSLGKTGAAAIAEMGFKKAEFAVRILAAPEPGPRGDCSCEFLFSANAGEPAMALSKIASSGELARVMLALKTILADLDGVPVLVFDEVDANVGGEIGRVVGGKLSQIAGSHQVFCVTHLPQVAAQGRSHLLVEKEQSDDRTSVFIRPLHQDRAARLAELARMLGDRNAKSALAHAGELLRG